MSHSITEDAGWRDVADRNAQFGEIYRENVDYVWRVLNHLGIKTSDVADVAHDVFLVVRRRLDSFEGRSTLRTWIYGICIRTVSDYRARAFRRREVLHDRVPEVGENPAQETCRSNAEIRGALPRLLAELDQGQREVFVLYEVEELSMKEVAQVVGCPLQTAYSRLHAARAQLKSRLISGGFKP